MKATLKASLYAAATLVLLASCYGPGGPRQPGPRGYTLDKPPGRYGNQQQPPPPADTRYLDPSAPIPGDRSTADVQPPNPNAPVTPDTITPPPSTTPEQPAVPPVTPTPPPPAVVKPPAPTASMPTASRTKTGFVKSPFDPLGREIDVREMRSGQKARCPYTQKVFLVP